MLNEARAAASSARHRKAFKAGESAMRIEADDANQFREAWRHKRRCRLRGGDEPEAPTRCHTFDAYNLHHKPLLPRAKALRKAGQVAYAAQRNATALALALYAQAVTSGERARRKGSVGFQTFCGALGLPRWDNYAANRSIMRALELVTTG